MELSQILQKSISQIALSGQGVKSYIIPQIPRRLLTRAWRTFCPQEKRNSILALIDTSFFQNGKEGFVFTQNALYIREAMHRVKVFPYDRINAIIYFQALSTYSGKHSISMEIDSKDYDYEISNVLLKGINTDLFNQMLQRIVSLYRPDERHEIAVFVRSLFLKIFAADVVIERHHADNTPVCDLRRRIPDGRVCHDRYHLLSSLFFRAGACPLRPLKICGSGGICFPPAFLLGSSSAFEMSARYLFSVWNKIRRKTLLRGSRARPPREK